MKSLLTKPIKPDGPVGFHVEVDLEIEESKKERLMDYPPVCDRRIVPKSEMSPNDPASEGTRLINNLAPKKNYRCNLHLLRMYQRLGYRVTKIHRAIPYQQKPMFRDFINKALAERRIAKKRGDDGLANAYKLVCNAIFGKTGQNVRKNVNYKFDYDEKTAWLVSTDPRSTGFSVFTENLAGAVLEKDTILLNKPQYLSPTILDLSKLHMLEFHYDVMQKHFGPKAKLVYTDTDSLVYLIECEDVFAELSHPSVNPYIDTTDSKLIKQNNRSDTCGLFKLEHKQDRLVEEFFCAGLKTYSLKVQGKEIYKNATKGFAMDDSKETHEEFRKVCVDNYKPGNQKRWQIRANKHTLNTVHTDRKGLERTLNGKRYAFINEEGQIDSMPYGLSRERYKDLNHE